MGTMNQHQDNYTLLLDKLDRFIRKYYINAMIRGSLYFLATSLVLFLLFSFLENQYYFQSPVRKIFFYGFILFSLTGFSYWILIPALKYFRLGKTISHEQAARIIGQHFTDIQDKLLNVLHLQKQLDSSEARALILAGIEQKSEKIHPIPFRKAIDLRKNRKYLRYALPPMGILMFILLASPGIITDSTARIIRNNEEFEKAAPFSFRLINDRLEIPQNEDFELLVETDGRQLPEQVYIRINGYQYRMKKDSINRFRYTFKNPFRDTDFDVTAGRVTSKKYTLRVLPKPSLEELEILLDFPAYTRRKAERILDSGDLLVPVGTRGTWNMEALNTDGIAYTFGQKDSIRWARKKGDVEFTFRKTLLSGGNYRLYISNKQLNRPDSVSYVISLIPDKYPAIDVESFRDSSENNYIYFVGNTSDDYGLNRLVFNYYILDEQGIKRKEISEILKRYPSGELAAGYDLTLDLDTIGLKPGESVQYYFEVFDNDGVNGPKSSRTALMQFAKPGVKEFEKKEEENVAAIEEKLKESMEEIRKMKRQIEKNREKLLQKKEPEWQDRKELEKLLEQQKELEKMLEEARKKFQENLQNQEQFREQNEQILEKQEQLQKMFEEILSDETKELLRKIEELMQDLQKDDMLEMMEEFQMDNETIEKELDRLMELFKSLELEKELNDQVEKLNELAEKQEALSEKTKKESENPETLEQKQEEINESFEELEDKMKEIMEKNKELERPKNLAKDNEQKMGEISDDLEKSQDELKQQQMQNAAKAQKSAAQKMKSMAGSLEMQMQSGEMEQRSEDLQALRQLLENLLTLSFEQEALIDDISATDPLTPKYKELVGVQFDLKEDFRMIEDSLQALSKRVIEIESFVTQKITDVKMDMKKTLEHLEGLETNNNLVSQVEQNVSEAQKYQRSTMKNINDLALMLDESMQQMQQNMAGGIPGSGSCNKPGGSGSPSQSGKKPSDKISPGQQSLNEMLKGMQQNGKNGQSGNSAKEFAQAAARQAALRKALEEMKKSLQEEGKGAGNDLQKIIDEMNKTEIDLVNKKLDNEMMRRQQDILSRLLDAEQADRQREYDNQRKAITARESERKIPPALQEYLKKREAELDLYKTVSPSLNPFYKNLVDEYYRALKSPHKLSE